MSKSIREQAAEAAAKVGAVVQITVEGIDEPVHVARLSLEQRSSVADTGLQPGRRANVAAALNLLAIAVVKPARENDQLVPYMSRDEWAAWAGEHTEVFYRLAVAVNQAQGDATAEQTEALGND
jgi:hypothetical protein